MIQKTLEELEMLDSETGEKILGDHYMIIQDPEREEVFARINTSTYNKRTREILKERYPSGLGDLERAGECWRYDSYVVRGTRNNLMGTVSQDLLKKGFPKIFEEFKKTNLPN